MNLPMQGGTIVVVVVVRVRQAYGADRLVTITFETSKPERRVYCQAQGAYRETKVSTI